MKTSKTILMLGAGLALVFGLTAFPVGAQTNVEEWPDAQKLADQWADAYNSHDGAAVGNLYHENAHLMEHGRPMIVGRKNIEQFWVNDFTLENPLTVLTVTHAVDGADMILVHGNYQVLDRNRGRRLGFGRFAHIWTLGTDGVWRIDRDLWNQPYEPNPFGR